MIVIPMAGLSSRFFNYGYKVPKYMLELNGETVFELSVKSFERYFKTDRFVFICRDIFGTTSFVKRKAMELGIFDFEVIVINHETRGQAETVLLGLSEADPESDVFIFNIDTFRPGYIKPGGDVLNKSGYLETFIGSGDNWSYILEGRPGEVVKTTEKIKISDHCCTGVYYFKKVKDFRDAFKMAEQDPKLRHNNEFYVAPLYNALIERGFEIGFLDVDVAEVIFCGTPSEYLALGGMPPEALT